MDGWFKTVPDKGRSEIGSVRPHLQPMLQVPLDQLTTFATSMEQMLSRQLIITQWVHCCVVRWQPYHMCRCSNSQSCFPVCEHGPKLIFFSVSLSLSLSVSLSLSLCRYLCFSLSLRFSHLFLLYISIYIYLSLSQPFPFYLFVCLAVCLSVVRACAPAWHKWASARGHLDRNTPRLPHVRFTSPCFAFASLLTFCHIVALLLA